MACNGNRMVCRRAVTTLCSLSCFVVFQSLSRVRLFVTHGLQHARLICPPLSPRVCSNWCLLSWWCCLAISSSAAPFSACPHSFPASGSFPMSWLVTSGSWSIRASASASVLPMNIQGWFPLGLISLIYWQSKASLVAQLVKNPPAMPETLVRFLDWEVPLEKG